MRRALKSADPDAFLLGEVWEDATTKESYNVGRRYALGCGLDSVMNYPFANHTVDFLLNRSDAFAYMRFLVSQSQNYPKEMYYALMNLLSSHDVARVRTVLATGEDGKGMSREEQAKFSAPTSAEDDARGEALVRCAAALQYSLPGIPVIYYGDEVGQRGLLDPFNRGTFPARAFDETGTLADWYRALGALRNARAALRTGGALYYSTNGDVVGVLRYCLGGKDAFGAPAADEMFLTVVNPDPEPRRIVVDLRAEKECLSFVDLAFIRAIEPRRAVHLLSSAGENAPQELREAAEPPTSAAPESTSERRGLPPGDSDNVVPITSGLLDISVPPYCAEVFEIEWE
jgi:glycosidase